MGGNLKTAGPGPGYSYAAGGETSPAFCRQIGDILFYLRLVSVSVLVMGFPSGFYHTGGGLPS